LKNDFEKQPERLDGTLKKFIKDLSTHTRDETERGQLILFDIVSHMAKSSYIFSKLKGIAFDLARAKATYTIKEQMVNCKKNCKKCPHGPYYYIYYRVQQKQSCRYLGKPLWQYKG
jgi:hypothetical protein